MANGELNGGSTTPPLPLGLRINLSIMMFLQFAIWGAWFVTLGNYLSSGLKFDNASIGLIYGTMALGTIFTPMIVGALADRYFASEKLMALLHLIGFALLYWMANIGEGQVATFYLAALLYAFVYSPTLALSNSITFSHVPDGGRDFPSIRVFGTIGWIAVGLAIGYLLPNLFTLSPGTKIDETRLPLMMAAVFSAILGAYSYFLPHTPPTGKAGDAMPALRAIGLLREFSFAVFFGVSFIITIVLAFYYGFTGIFLDNAIFPQIPPSSRPTSVAPIMSIGQISEMIILPFLPLFLYRFGMKYVLALGMAAWGIRYFLFALGADGTIGPWIVIASLAFHGVCFDFFFAAGFIHVDKTAPPAVRASGQALFTFLTYGVGMFLGNTISGYVVDRYALWNRVGGDVVFTKVVDDYYRKLGVDAGPETKSDLKFAISSVTGGGLQASDPKNPPTLALLGETKSDFDKNEPALKDALQTNISDAKEAGQTFKVLEFAHQRYLYVKDAKAWEETVEKLKKEDRPKSEYPPKPEKPDGPDYRNWYAIWIIPSVGVLISLLIFLAFFRNDSKPGVLSR